VASLLCNYLSPMVSIPVRGRQTSDKSHLFHVRAALLGPSLTVPFVNGRLTLGTWQQIIFVDFDNRSRRRELVVQIMGA
jgi:secondary thiamine-phosphate synthase enzyme